MGIWVLGTQRLERQRDGKVGAEAESRTALREGRHCVLDMAGTVSSLGERAVFPKPRFVHVLIEVPSVAAISLEVLNMFASVLGTSYPSADIRPKTASVPAASASQAAWPVEVDTGVGVCGSRCHPCRPGFTQAPD